MLLYSLLQGNYNYMSFVDTTTAVQRESLARPIIHEATGCVYTPSLRSIIRQNICKKAAVIGDSNRSSMAIPSRDSAFVHIVACVR